MWLLLPLLLSPLTCAALRSLPFPLNNHPSFVPANLPPPNPSYDSRPGLQNCTLRWYKQRTDHFNYAPPIKAAPFYQQRYFFCDSSWRRRGDGKAGPIFFYTGNEADVTLYVNHTGLMWENADKYGALLVFAEHRYYGVSLIENADLSYLAVDQALADFASLILHLKHTHRAIDAPVIAFGGSYGGQLSAWFRLKYPGTVHGAISASAPILEYVPAATPVRYWEMVSWDYSAKHGAAPACADSIRAAWPLIDKYAETDDGRTKLQEAFHLCNPLQSPGSASGLRSFLSTAFETLAMSNFPYPSNYLTAAAGQKDPRDLPAWPCRVACEYLSDKTLSSRPLDLFYGLAQAAGVYHNASQDKVCYRLENEYVGADLWEYQTCTQMFSIHKYFEKDGLRDIFWAERDDWQATAEWCQAKYDVIPDPDWATLQFGTLEDMAKYGSNIVFTNGNYDPWYGAGVLKTLNPTLVSIDIDQGAHHLDLMFSHPKDTPSVLEARKIQLEHISRWINEAYQGPPTPAPPANLHPRPNARPIRLPAFGDS